MGTINSKRNVNSKFFHLEQRSQLRNFRFWVLWGWYYYFIVMDTDRWLAERLRKIHALHEWPSISGQNVWCGWFYHSHVSAIGIVRVFFLFCFFHEKPKCQRADIGICFAMIQRSENEKLKAQEYNMATKEHSLTRTWNLSALERQIKKICS